MEKRTFERRIAKGIEDHTHKIWFAIYKIPRFEISPVCQPTLIIYILLSTCIGVPKE
jgi:hypothetical protein